MSQVLASPGNINFYLDGIHTINSFYLFSRKRCGRGRVTYGESTPTLAALFVSGFLSHLRMHCQLW